jgi:membrane protein
MLDRTSNARSNKNSKLFRRDVVLHDFSQQVKRVMRGIAHLIRRYQQDDVSSLAAQLTYFLILSFFPFLIFLLTLVSFTPFSSERILEHVKPLLADQFYEVVTTYIEEFFNHKQSALLSVSMFGMLWASSQGVLALMKGLNKAYDIEDNRPYWKIRLISVVFTIGFSGVILLSLLLLVFGQMIGTVLANYVQQTQNFHFTWHMIQYAFPILIMFVVFVWVYRVVPNRKLRIRQVMPGAMYSTAGWLVSSIVFASYVNIWDSVNFYGSIGGVMFLLIWIYMSSIHLLIGGQINALLVRDHK